MTKNIEVEVYGFNSQKEFDEANKKHIKIMKKVEEKFKDRPKDKFGNLIISEEVSTYILKLKKETKIEKTITRRTQGLTSGTTPNH